MSLDLELAVNRTLMRARAAERALHDRTNPWSLETAGRRVATSPMLDTDRIVFTGVIPAELPERGSLVLRCGEDVVDVAELHTAPGGGGTGCWTEVRHEIVVGTA